MLSGCIAPGPSGAERAAPRIPASPPVAAFAEVCLDTAPNWNLTAELRAAHGLIPADNEGAWINPAGGYGLNTGRRVSPEVEIVDRCAVTIAGGSTDRLDAEIQAQLEIRDIYLADRFTWAGAAGVEVGGRGWRAEGRIGDREAVVLFGRLESSDGIYFVTLDLIN